MRTITTRTHEVRNDIVEVRSDEVLLASERTEEPRKIRYDWIRGQVDNYPHGAIVLALREVLGIDYEPPPASSSSPTAGLDRGFGASPSRAHVVGLLILDAAQHPYLLTTYKPSENLANPCALRWDGRLHRWSNTSETRKGKETAIHLMEELGVRSDDCHITHHYMFKLVRSAWHQFEDVLYDRIRKN